MSREEIEQKIRDLKQELSTSEECGDWVLVKAFEGLISTLASQKTITGFITAFVELQTSLVNVIQKRIQIRTEIEELEDELKKEEE